MNGRKGDWVRGRPRNKKPQRGEIFVEKRILKE
jgi:hypothetical protein